MTKRVTTLPYAQWKLVELARALSNENLKVLVVDDMGSVGGITKGPDGVVYGYAQNSHALFTVDLETGLATVLHYFGPDVPVFYALSGSGSVSPVESTSWSKIKSMYIR